MVRQETRIPKKTSCQKDIDKANLMLKLLIDSPRDEVFLRDRMGGMAVSSFYNFKRSVLSSKDYIQHIRFEKESKLWYTPQCELPNNGLPEFVLHEELIAHRIHNFLNRYDDTGKGITTDVMRKELAIKSQTTFYLVKKLIETDKEWRKKIVYRKKTNLWRSKCCITHETAKILQCRGQL